MADPVETYPGQRTLEGPSGKPKEITSEFSDSEPLTVRPKSIQVIAGTGLMSVRGTPVADGGVTDDWVELYVSPGAILPVGPYAIKSTGKPSGLRVVGFFD